MILLIAPGGCGGNFLAGLLESNVSTTDSNEYIFARWKPYTTVNSRGEVTGSPNSSIILLHNVLFTFGFEQNTNTLNEKIISLETEYDVEIDEVIIIRYNKLTEWYVKTLNSIKWWNRRTTDDYEEHFRNVNDNPMLVNVSDEDIENAIVNPIVIDYQSFFFFNKKTNTYLDQYLPQVLEYTLQNFKLIHKFFKEKK